MKVDIESQKKSKNRDKAGKEKFRKPIKAQRQITHTEYNA